MEQFFGHSLLPSGSVSGINLLCYHDKKMFNGLVSQFQAHEEKCGPVQKCHILDKVNTLVVCILLIPGCNVIQILVKYTFDEIIFPSVC